MSNDLGSTSKAKYLLQSLIKAKVNFTKIVGFVFDTTATNSDLNKAIVVQLQSEFGHPVFRLACRHHILELVCASIGRNVFGSATEFQKEPLFKQFAMNWTAIIITMPLR